MEVLNTYLLETATIISTATVAFVFLAKHRAQNRNRTRELNIAKIALQAHYDAVERIIDDPALPEKALEILVALEEIVSSRQESAKFAEFLLKHPIDSFTKNSKQSESIIKTVKSNPNISESFYKAVATGVTAVILRDPSISSKFQVLIEISAKETQRGSFATGVLSRFWSNDSNNNGDPHLPGNAVAI